MRGANDRGLEGGVNGMGESNRSGAGNGAQGAEGRYGSILTNGTNLMSEFSGLGPEYRGHGSGKGYGTGLRDGVREIGSGNGLGSGIGVRQRKELICFIMLLLQLINRL